MQPVTDIIENVSIDDVALDSISYADSHLLAHLWPGGLSYAIYSRVENRFVSLHELHFGNDNNYAETLEVFANRPVFGKLFREVRIAIDERLFTLVPRNLYDSKAVLQYLDLFEPDVSETIGKDTIAAIDAVNVYSLPVEPVNHLKSIFMAPSIMATSTVLLQQCLREQRNNKDDLLFAHLHNTRLDVIALEKGRLVFYNRFTVKAPEDLSYYLLAVTEQAMFNTDTVQVWLTGSINEDYLQAAQKYFQGVQQGSRPRAFHYSEAIDALPIGAFYPLFSLNACEL